MKKIICISGKQYSGKDTLAKVLLKELKMFKRIGIADAIKEEYSKKLGLSVEEIEANKGKYRTALIELGNEKRSISKDYWLDKIINLKEDIIVSDVRLVHEIELFKKHGAYLIRINADYTNRTTRGTITNSNDLTECELDIYKEFNYTIQNNGSIEDLEENSKPLILDIKEYFNLN